MTANTPYLEILTLISDLDTVSPMKWPLPEIEYWVRLISRLRRTPFLISLESMVVLWFFTYKKESKPKNK